MKLHYFEETDSLYIDLSEAQSESSRELSRDFVVDYDAEGQVVGFDIQHASRHLDLSRVETMHLPISCRCFVRVSKLIKQRATSHLS